MVLYTFKKGEMITSPAARAIASPMAGPPKADLKMFSTTSPPLKRFPVSMSRKRKKTTEETPSHRWLSPMMIMEKGHHAHGIDARKDGPKGDGELPGPAVGGQGILGQGGEQEGGGEHAWYAEPQDLVDGPQEGVQVHEEGVGEQ
eukprot:scaffold25_cov342-Pavlova_lutheri.AAC.74